LKQISFVVWFEKIDDNALSHLESAWKEIVRAIDSSAKFNIIKKERNLNIPRGERV